MTQFNDRISEALRAASIRADEHERECRRDQRWLAAAAVLMALALICYVSALVGGIVTLVRQ